MRSHDDNVVLGLPLCGSQLVVALQPTQLTTRSHSCLQVNVGWLQADSTRLVPSLHSQYPDRAEGTCCSQPRSDVLSRGPFGLHPVVDFHPTQEVGVP